MIRVARALLDHSPENPTLEQAKTALRPLAKVDWKLHHVPWRGLLLVYAPDRYKWLMRSEDRKRATDTADQLLRWITGNIQFNKREENDLRDRWQAGLGTLPTDDKPDDLWEKIKRLRRETSA